MWSQSAKKQQLSKSLAQHRSVTYLNLAHTLHNKINWPIQYTRNTVRIRVRVLAVVSVADDDQIVICYLAIFIFVRVFIRLCKLI